MELLLKFIYLFRLVPVRHEANEKSLVSTSHKAQVTLPNPVSGPIYLIIDSVYLDYNQDLVTKSKYNQSAKCIADLVKQCF